MSEHEEELVYQVSASEYELLKQKAAECDVYKKKVAIALDFIKSINDSGSRRDDRLAEIIQSAGEAFRRLI